MRTIDQILASIAQLGAQTEFLPTGFRSIDTLLDGGFMRKELVVLGGFTGIGKSFVSAQIAWNIANNGFRIAYFSLEISAEMIVSRLIGSLSGVKPTRVIHADLSDAEREEVEQAKLAIQAYSDFFHIYDEVYQLMEIGELILNGAYDFVVIDFLQNVFHRGEEYERMSFISLYFQKLAKKANCCILAVSQLSNSANRTGVLEYKGSGGIATVCDLGFFLKRLDTAGGMSSIELVLRKNRRGPVGYNFSLEFNVPGGRIYEKE